MQADDRRRERCLQQLWLANGLSVQHPVTVEQDCAEKSYQSFCQDIVCHDTKVPFCCLLLLLVLLGLLLSGKG